MTIKVIKADTTEEALRLLKEELDALQAADLKASARRANEEDAKREEATAKAETGEKTQGPGGGPEDARCNDPSYYSPLIEKLANELGALILASSFETVFNSEELKGAPLAVIDAAVTVAALKGLAASLASTRVGPGSKHIPTHVNPKSGMTDSEFFVLESYISTGLFGKSIGDYEVQFKAAYATASAFVNLGEQVARGDAKVQ